MFDALDAATISIGIFVLVCVAGTTGYLAGRSRLFTSIDARHLGVVQGAAFALVSLLLAFSFSLALTRYDARRGAVLHESNAIGSAILRTQLLDDKTATAMRADLRRYLDVRVAFAAADADPAKRAKLAVQSGALQRDMWALAIDATRRGSPTSTMPLVLNALNETMDAGNEEAAVSAAHIPDAVLALLIAIVVIAVALLGLGADSVTLGRAIPIGLFAFMLALVVTTILDLDRPQRGNVRVDLEPLQALYQLL